MSDLILNIRFGLWHFQITYRLRFRISKNEYHRGYPHGRFALHEFSPRRFLWNFRR
jgi:hypothetical protein